MNAPGLDKKQIRQQFSRAAKHYENHDFLQREVAERAFERLEYMQLAPEFILDLGAGTGRGARYLAQQFKRAKIIETDLSASMLGVSRAQQSRWLSRHRYVCADVEQLPFANDRFDLVYAGLSLQWCQNLEQSMAQIQNLTAEKGLFLFTTLGPDTLKELKAAFASITEANPVNEFLDMHVVGDCLTRAGFADPVLRTDIITVEYEEVFTLMRDLKGIGATNAHQQRGRGLAGRRYFSALATAYEQHRRNGKLPATWEVVIGHAWGSAGPAPQRGGEQVFPLSRLRRR